MLTVTRAWDQRGWSNRDHALRDRPSEMVGNSYRNLSALRSAALRLSDSYPMVEYTNEGKRYRYDGSPSIPGRRRAVVTALD